MNQIKKFLGSALLKQTHEMISTIVSESSAEFQLNSSVLCNKSMHTESEQLEIQLRLMLSNQLLNSETLN